MFINDMLYIIKNYHYSKNRLANKSVLHSIATLSIYVIVTGFKYCNRLLNVISYLNLPQLYLQLHHLKFYGIN